MNLVFNNCFGCVELRTGCLVIAYLNLIKELIIMALCIMGIISGTAVIAHGNHGEDIAIGEVVEITFAVVLAVVLAFILLALAFDVVLLVGLHENKRRYIKSYLIFNTILLVLSIVGWLYGFRAAQLDAVNISLKLCGILINIYFLLVIRSHYYKMEDADKTPGVHASS